MSVTRSLLSPQSGRGGSTPIGSSRPSWTSTALRPCRRTRAAPRLSNSKMNPDKLFDYLEGKLSPSERAELEERLMSDPQVRRELTVARKIHSDMRDSREILGVAESAVEER